MKKGFIKVSRSILNWRWYQDHNTKVLFLYLLYHAAWKPYKDRRTGVEVSRGQCFLSTKMAAADTGMSDKNVRTALKHLEDSGTISRVSGPAGTMVSIENYEQFQAQNNNFFVMLPRAFMDWNWKKEARTLLLFLHIILLSELQNATNTVYPHLCRGQAYISVASLADALSQTDRAVRTDIKILQQYGLISVDSTGRGSTISVQNVDTYLGAPTKAVSVPEEVTSQMTNGLPPKRQTKTEKATNKTASQMTNQISFIDGLGKLKTNDVEFTSGEPKDKQSGEPNAEKWRTVLPAGGKQSGKPSLYKEELEKNRRREEYAHERETPSPLPPAEVAFAEAAFTAMPSCASPGGNVRGRASRLDAEQVTALYMELCPSLPVLSIPLTKYRRRTIEQLLAQYPDETVIRQIFQKAEDSDYLKGCDNYGWKADFDWLIDLRHVPRILEGAYDHLWESKKRDATKGGYVPADSQPPTYDMGEYVDYSMKRVLGG